MATPIDTTNLAGKTITQVAAGEHHSLLLADDGSVFSIWRGELWSRRPGAVPRHDRGHANRYDQPGRQEDHAGGRWQQP